MQRNKEDERGKKKIIRNVEYRGENIDTENNLDDYQGSCVIVVAQCPTFNLEMQYVNTDEW